MTKMWKNKLATKSLTDFMSNINDTIDTATENEPNFECITEVKRRVCDMLSRRR
jgi:hypothetical protein